VDMTAVDDAPGAEMLARAEPDHAATDGLRAFLRFMTGHIDVRRLDPEEQVADGPTDYVAVRRQRRQLGEAGAQLITQHDCATSRSLRSRPPRHPPPPEDRHPPASR